MWKGCYSCIIVRCTYGSFKLCCSLLPPLFQLSDYLKENEAETLHFRIKMLTLQMLTHLNFETVSFLSVGKHKPVYFSPLLDE